MKIQREDGMLGFRPFDPTRTTRLSVLYAGRTLPPNSLVLISVRGRVDPMAN